MPLGTAEAAISNIEIGGRGDGRNLSPFIVQRAFIFQTPDSKISVFGVVGASNTSVFGVVAGASLVVSRSILIVEGHT